MANPTIGIPAPPEGFTDDEDQAGRSIELTQHSSSDIPPPPEGFTADEPAVDTPPIPAPPAGFTDDEPQMPGILQAGMEGFKTAIHGENLTGGMLAGNMGPQEMDVPSAAAEPIGWKDLTSPIETLGPKVAYQLASGSPTIAGGIAGAAIGSPGGPIGEILGGGAGAAVGSIAQTMGPAFQQELQKTPNDPDAAFERALKTTTNSGAWAAIGWLVGGVPFFKSTVKNILLQTFGVQPGVMTAQKATQNVIEGKPASEGVGETYGNAVVAGAAIVGGHAGYNKAAHGRFFPEPEVAGGVPGREDAVPPPLPDGVPPPPEGFTDDIQPAMKPSSIGPMDYITAFGKRVIAPNETTVAKSVPDELANIPQEPSQVMPDESMPPDSGLGPSPMFKYRGQEETRTNDEGPAITPDESGYLGVQIHAKNNLALVPPKFDPTDFLSTSTMHDDGKSVTLDRAYDHYVSYAEVNKQPVLPREAFLQGMLDAGYTRQLIAGKVRLIGLGLKDGLPPDVPPKSPMGDMRFSIMGPDRPTQDSANQPYVPAATDAAEISSMDGTLSPVRDAMLNEPYYRTRRQNELDSSVDRYIINDGKDFHLYNATDLEESIAMRGNQPEPPNLRKVDMASLDKHKITAAVHDLPERGSSRISYGRVDPDDYAAMRQMGTLGERLPVYMRMVEEGGLRIVPGPGKTFMYAGPMVAEKIERVPKSQRSQYVIKTVKTTLDNDQHVLMRDPYALDDNMTNWATVDMAQIDPNDYVSMDPSRSFALVGVKNPETRDQLERIWRSAAQDGDVGMIRELARRGLYVPPDRINGGYFTDRTIIHRTRADIPIKEQVPAYMPNPEQDRQLPLTSGPAQDALGEVEITGRGSIQATSPRIREKANEIATVLRGIKPVTDYILQRMGAERRPQFLVDMSLDKSPYVDPGRGTIVIPADYQLGFAKARNSLLYGDTTTQVQQITYHELGHLVTFRSWEKTPANLRELVVDGYNRARLQYNLTGQSFGTDSLFIDPTHSQTRYWLSFPEYMAEQFRRWASSDQKVLSATDTYYKDASLALKKTYDEIDAKWGKAVRNQMFQADWTFNTWMGYVEAMTRKGQSPLQFSSTLQRMALEPPTSAKISETLADVTKLADELQHLFPDDYQRSLEVNDPFQSRVGGLDMGSVDKDRKMIRLMLGSMAWIKDRGQLIGQAENTIVHEAWHSVEDFITGSTRQILLQAAKLDNVMDAQTQSMYKRYYMNEYLKQGASREEAVARTNKDMENEWIAHLVEKNWQGFRYGEQANGILDKLSGFFEKIGNFLQGKGFTRAEDILHEFYRGEITERYNRASRADRDIIPPRPSAKVEDLVRAGYKPITTPRGERLYAHREDEPDGTTFQYYDSRGKRAGYLAVDGRGEIQMIRADLRGKAVPEAMLEHAAGELGHPFKTAALLTAEGYNMLRRRAPERVKYYTKDAETGMYMSPKHVWNEIDTLKRQLARTDTYSNGSDRVWWKDYYKKRIERLEQQAKGIPDTAKEDPAILQQWSSRSREMDQWLRAAEERDSQLQYHTTGDDSMGPVEDSYSKINREQNKQEAAGNPIGAIRQAEMPSMLGIFRRYGDRNPNVRRRIRGTLPGTENDRTYSLHLWGNKSIQIGKYGLMIRQLAWINPHIPQLRDYISLRDQQQQRVMQWISRADERVRTWDRNLPAAERNGLSNLLFWATEMRYRTQAERRARVLRMPTAQELATEARRQGVGVEGMALYNQISGDFMGFLGEVERISGLHIQRTFANNPQQMVLELNQLRADMVRLRARPYFPMVRFGKYALTGRDPVNNRVTHFSLYQTPAERDAAVEQVRTQHRGNIEMQITKVPEGVLDFMGLPGPLLQRLKNNLPGITQAQMDWMDRFSMLMAPEQSFKKRWLERQGTEGYSLDGVRAYAHYFRSGSRYLARLEFNDQIRAVQTSLDRSVSQAADGTSRQTIADIVNQHAKDMDQPGKDWTKLKAMTFLFQLGFSPVAAIMNLTQVPVVTYPYLSGIFGERAVLAMGGGVAQAGRRTMFTRSLGTNHPLGQIADPGLRAAHGEMVRQGRIDIGQAAELGSYAENSRMDQTFMGQRTEQAMRSLSYWSAFMFGNAERFNREWTFETAYKMAMQDPNNRHVIDLTTAKHRDWADVMARTGMTSEQASAFLVAREAIDRTQGVYQSWDRPKALRGPVAQATRIYFMYTQQMMFALANNPGRLKMLLILGALYGVMGLPGADDIDALVHGVAAKVFGKDFSLQKAVREFVAAHTKGTFLDKVGPDLALHGISRYGFGMSLMPEHMGWPQFDASSNGSMGQLVPGFADAMNGWANSGSDPSQWKDTTTKVLQDVAGPGLGTFVPWMKYMNSAPYGGDQKKWEAVLPRSLKALAKAYHMAADGGITNSQGAVTAKMDWNDPDDRATIIAQGLGFTPRVVNEGYEQYEMNNSTDMFYKAKKAELTTDLYRAMRLQDSSAANDVIRGIKDYNAEVAKEGLPALSIQTGPLVSGLRQRLKNKEKTELGIPQTNGQMQIQQKNQALFPGLIETKKVR